jgi:CRP-like cAMP-binding protein
MPHSKNALLARLDKQSVDHIRVHLRVAELHHGDVLAETHEVVQQVYFPHSGIISCVVVLKDGSAIETGMIGHDGQYGAGPALDDKLSFNRVIIQVPGTASVIDADHLREAVVAIPSLRKIVMAYEEFFLAHVQQTAACNAVHDVQHRMCKWLLRMHDLVGADLPLTQEFVAQMMGVRRTSVTEVAGDMQRAGLISYVRGRLHIIDVDLVRAHACECHAAISSHYDLI